MRTIAAISLLCCLMSCVPQRQYAELEKENARLSRMLGLTDSTAMASRSAFEAVDEEMNMEEEYAQLLRQNESLRVTNINLNKSYQELLERYTRIIETNEGMADTDLQTERGGEQQAYLRELQQEINRQEERLRFLQESYNQDISARDDQIAQLQNELFRRDQELRQMRQAMSRVQANFPANELDVTEQDGRLYVSLSQELLFRTGSARLDRSGREAIRQIAEALQGLPRIEVMVEGHTDNQGAVDRNWQLSLDRALAVTQELIDSGIDPDQVIAAGRGEHNPRASNDTPFGRAQNRRTEIILIPETVVGSN